MSRPFDDRGVVGEVGGVVEFIGTTEQFRVEDLRRLYDSQRIAVDRVRSVGRELPQGIDGFDDRNSSTMGRRTLHGFQNQVGRYQRTYAVVDRDQCDGSGQSGQAVAYRVEPLRPARRAGVLGYVETGCQILTEIDLSLGKDDDDLRAVQRSCKGVYRMAQYRQRSQHAELFGKRTSQAAAAPAGDDDYSCSLLFHISFFPNPRVLSVNFM